MPKRYVIFVISGVIISGALYYWFAYRPTSIKRQCNNIAIEASKGSSQVIETPKFYYNTVTRQDVYSGTNKQYIDTSSETYLAYYSACIHKHGL